MFNPLAIWRGNGKLQKQAERNQDIKNRILKNEEVILEAMGKRAQGVKACPFYLGSKCVADACMFWTEFKNINSETGKEFNYFDCSIHKIPLLQIELLRDINLLKNEIRK